MSRRRPDPGPPEGFLQPPKKLNPAMYNRRLLLGRAIEDQKRREGAAYEAHRVMRKINWLKKTNEDRPK